MLLPNLVERRLKCIQMRQVPTETFKALQDANLFRLFQPKRYGGYEAEPIDCFDIQREFSSACPNTGWTWGVLSVHAWHVSLFPQQAQDDVWSHSPTTLIASSYSPVGKRIEVVDSGYRLSGRWDFCSGIDHVQWCLLGGLVRGERPEFRTFLVNQTDYVIDDNWHVTGLQGTGSKTIVLNNAFVPEYRTHRIRDAFKTCSPGNAVNTSLLYKLPFGQVLVRSISTPVLGMTTGALDAYLTLMRSKASTTSNGPTVDDPRVLEILARCRSEVEMLSLKMRANFEEMWRYVRDEREIPIERRTQFKYESADTVARCCELLNQMMASAGAEAISVSNALSLFHADALAARAHFGNNAPFFARSFGGVMLGRELADPFV